MNQTVSSRWQEILAAIEAPPQGDQAQLMELLRERSLAYRRAELVAQVAEGRQTFQQKMVQTYRTETTVSSDGILTLAGLPFHAGDRVQVIVSDRRVPTGGERYPLRGRPVRYTAPFESVVEDDWEALQ